MEIITSLRRAIPWEEFDYQILLDALRDYAIRVTRFPACWPRGSSSGVKKGLYVFGDAYRSAPIRGKSSPI